MTNPTLEADTLDAGVQQLLPLLSSYGFSRKASHTGSSSGGPYATATFVCDKLEIGLIVRFKSELGCPNYTEGKGFAGHSRLIAKLNQDYEPSLVSDGSGITYCSADGGDAFLALRDDLDKLILPAFRDAPEAFSDALVRAHKEFMRRLTKGG